MEVQIKGIDDGKVYNATIEVVDMNTFPEILKTGHFTKQNWTNLNFDCNQGEVYKLSLGDEILGLIFFYNETTQQIIELNKIELTYKVPDKKYENVAGCLIAYCCDRSKDDVYVLCRDEKLRSLYINKYGMKPCGDGDMAFSKDDYILCDKGNGELLIAQYLK